MQYEQTVNKTILASVVRISVFSTTTKFEQVSHQHKLYTNVVSTSKNVNVNASNGNTLYGT